MLPGGSISRFSCRRMTAEVALLASIMLSSLSMAFDNLPSRFQLGQSLPSYATLGDVRLRALDLSTIPVQEFPDSLSLNEVAKDHSGTVGSVAFVLSELAASHFDDKFGLWAIVKETNVDDEGLQDFYQKYFTFDIFRDERLAVYEAMGSRKIALRTWNPIRLYRGFRDLTTRVKEKNIEGNLKGEGMIQGGILFFDKSGLLQFTCEEEIGDELDVDDILSALQLMEVGTTSRLDQEL